MSETTGPDPVNTHITVAEEDQMLNREPFADALKALMAQYADADRKSKMDALDAEYEILSEQRPTFNEAIEDLLVEYHDVSHDDLQTAVNSLQTMFPDTP
jgi:hypothetical protein